MLIGAHVSAAGGAHKAVERALEIGAESVQMFASSPRRWAFRAQKPGAVKDFRNLAREAGLGPTFLHGSYLVNLGAGPELAEKSTRSLTEHMGAALELGAAGVIFHAGSHKGRGFDSILGQVERSLSQVLSDTSGGPLLIIENSAGAGNHIGASFEEIGRIIDAIGSRRVRVCIDTQHAFAAGYRLTSRDGVSAMMEEFDRAIGLENLAAVHANDSKTELGSGVDRHENIGLGHIGERGFAAVMSHPALREVPFLLEVPGMEGGGPDRANVDALKSIRAAVAG